MAFDAGKHLDAALHVFEASLKAAYEQGVADGREEALRRVLEAVREPEAGAQRTEAREPLLASAAPIRMQRAFANDGDVKGRAPRGLVPTVLAQAMAEHPGGTIKDYEAVVCAMDPRISAKSVGNEIRRGDGERYRRDGYKWYLIEEGNEAADTTLAGESAASSSTMNQGGSDARTTLALSDMMG